MQLTDADFARPPPEVCASRMIQPASQTLILLIPITRGTSSHWVRTPRTPSPAFRTICCGAVTQPPTSLQEMRMDVDVLDNKVDPKVFWEEYVEKHKPVLFRGGSLEPTKSSLRTAVPVIPNGRRGPGPHCHAERQASTRASAGRNGTRSP